MSDAESPLLGKPEVPGPPQREFGYCMDVDGAGKLACAPTAKGKRCLFGVICPLQVTHSKEIAWQMSIFGQHECDGGSDHLCNRNIDVGWKVYSLEKLYMRPPLYNATFINGTLSFTTHTQFKTSAKTTGTWRLTLDDGDQTLAEVPFNWEAHFRATVVEAVVDADVPVGSTLGLYVANEFETESYLPIVVGEKWSRTEYYDDDDA